MSDPIARRILDHLADARYQPRQLRQLADDLGVNEQAFEAFGRTVEQLVSEGHVILGSAGTVTLPPLGREMFSSL